MILRSKRERRDGAAENGDRPDSTDTHVEVAIVTGTLRPDRADRG
jgi:hypothetical protein